MADLLLPDPTRAAGGAGAVAAPPVAGRRDAARLDVPRWLVSILPTVLLLVFIVVFAELNKSTVGASRTWIDLGTEALYLAAVAVGVNILLGYTGLLSLGHAGFFVAGGYAGAVWATDWGLSPWLGIVVAFFFGAALGVLLAVMCAHLRGFYLTVVTLAFGALLPALVVLLKSILGGPTGRNVTSHLHAGRFVLAHGNPYLGLYYTAAGLLLVALALSWNLTRSRWGRACMAVRDSETAARASGVNAYLCKVAAFALSAGIVAAAGAIGAHRIQLVSPDAGSQEQSFRYVIMVALGGMGTLAGPVLGAFGVTFGFGWSWVQNHLSNEMGLLFGGLGVIGVALAPEGQMGNLKKQVRAWQLRQARRGRTTAHRPPPAVPAALTRPVPRTAADARVGSLLSTDGLTKRFGGLTALADIDLDVAAGTVHAVIGPNGSGKTTLINVLTGFYFPDGGVIRFRGEDVSALKSHQRAALGMSRTFQNLRIWPRMTLLENVMVGGHCLTEVGLVPSLLGTPSCRRVERELRLASYGMLQFVGLADRAREPAGSLPFADQRRLEIARALASEPDVLLLDEPAAGMHPAEVHQLVELIQEIRACGVTVLLVEHHMDLVMGVSDTVSVLDYGTKISEGAPDLVKADQRVIEAYLGPGEVA